MVTRTAIALVIAAGIVGPSVADAQPQARVPRIGFLCAMAGPSAHTEGFQEGLRELGYVEGKDIVVEYRFTAGRNDPFPDLAAELVRLKVDVIVVASPPAIGPAKAATKTIPIVMAQSDDPVGAGFVASLARPGGNVTGLTSMAAELSGKQLELLKEAVPRVSRVAVLGNGANPAGALQLERTEAAARALGVTLQLLEVRGAADLDRAFAAIRRDRAEALIVLPDLLFFDYQRELVEFATRNNLPSMYGFSLFAEVGGLMSYGTSDRDLFRRAAHYVDKILKGARPADLPVEQPRRFELVLNLKTARTLGLAVPRSVLIRTDRVIE